MLTVPYQNGPGIPRLVELIITDITFGNLLTTRALTSPFTGVSLRLESIAALVDVVIGRASFADFDFIAIHFTVEVRTVFGTGIIAVPETKIWYKGTIQGSLLPYAAQLYSPCRF